MLHPRPSAEPKLLGVGEGKREGRGSPLLFLALYLSWGRKSAGRTEIQSLGGGGGGQCFRNLDGRLSAENGRLGNFSKSFIWAAKVEVAAFLPWGRASAPRSLCLVSLCKESALELFSIYLQALGTPQILQI